MEWENWVQDWQEAFSSLCLTTIQKEYQTACETKSIQDIVLLVVLKTNPPALAPLYFGLHQQLMKSSSFTLPQVQFILAYFSKSQTPLLELLQTKHPELSMISAKQLFLKAPVELQSEMKQKVHGHKEVASLLFLFLQEPLEWQTSQIVQLQGELCSTEKESDRMLPSATSSLELEMNANIEKWIENYRLAKRSINAKKDPTLTYRIQQAEQFANTVLSLIGFE
jgi:hypothetical protein